MAKMEDVLKGLAEKYKPNVEEDEYISSGSIIFDAVLSKGKGIPKKKFIQISSDSGVGKTTLVLHASRVACSKGLRVIYLDVEKGVNEDQLKGIGLLKYLNDKFFLFPISTFEEAEEVLDKILDDEGLAYVVIDSITALIPAKTIEKSIAEVEPGLNARYASAFLAKYKAILERSKSKASFIFINQMRNKLNFMRGSTYEAAGGSAQKFYMDIRIMMVRTEKLEKTIMTLEGKRSVPYGANVKVWAEKNRHNRPFLEGIMTVLIGKGISNIAAYQRVLMQKGVLTMAGAGFYTLTLPGKEPLKSRGSAGVSDCIKQNLADIKAYVDSVGGINLIEDDGGGDV